MLREWEVVFDRKADRWFGSWTRILLVAVLIFLLCFLFCLVTEKGLVSGALLQCIWRKRRYGAPWV